MYFEYIAPRLIEALFDRWEYDCHWSSPITTTTLPVVGRGVAGRRGHLFVMYQTDPAPLGSVLASFGRCVRSHDRRPTSTSLVLLASH
jgi:hypothetical protein